MAKQIIGKDVTAYLVNAGGIDTSGSSPSAGAAYQYLGKWKSFELTVSQKWFETTSSDGGVEERRDGPSDWKCTISGQVRGDTGSNAITLALGTNYIYVTFTESATGKTMSMVGGISEGSGTFGQEPWDDKLEVLCTGQMPTYQ